MDLLEYIRERNRMTQEEWESTFEKQTQEIIVLRHEGGGGHKRNGFWVRIAYFLAYVDLKDGSLHKDKGRLVYPVGEEEYENDASLWRFEEESIYRLKVRRKIKESFPEGLSQSSQNEFLVAEIIEKDAKCRPLEEILTKYQKPVILHDDVLGELTLNKQLSCFEGTVCWNNRTVDISLDVNKDNKSSWTKARKAMKTMLSEQDKWDREMRSFAAKQLTALACDWRASADEAAAEITEESFARRIELKNISVTASGSFSAYFDDDDMFFGHCVTVGGSLKKGILSAEMEG